MTTGSGQSALRGDYLSCPWILRGGEPNQRSEAGPALLDSRPGPTWPGPVVILILKLDTYFAAVGPAGPRTGVNRSVAANGPSQIATMSWEEPDEPARCARQC
jgi:hypothetical protein